EVAILIDPHAAVEDADRRDAVVEAPRQRGIRAAARHAEILAAEVRVLVEAGPLARELAAPPDRRPAAAATRHAPDLHRRDLVVPAAAAKIADVVGKAGRA